jgi:hypothetical protein
MSFSGPSRAPLSLAALCLLGLALLAARPAPASAAGYTCEASALAATIGPSPRIEPITANKGESTCKTAQAGGNLPASPLPVTGSLLSATTEIQPPSGDPAGQTATAAGGLGELRVAGLPIPLQRPDTSQLPGPQTIPGVATIDVRAAVEALVPKDFSAQLLDVKALRAQVVGKCVNGSPQLTGTSSVASVNVLGQELPTDRATTTTLNAVDTSNIDPSNLNPDQLGIPGVTIGPVIQQFLDALPTISIPATAVQVKVTPGQKITGGGKLTQHALDLSITAGGQNVLALTVGDATVGSANVNCGGVADLALECTSRKLVLIDVYERAGRVQLLGAANRRFAGQRVRIVFTATGKTVARPLVTAGGLFRGTAKLPPLALRGTNRARYQARISKQSSLRLKLRRRLIVSSTAAKGGRVTIAGRVTRPLGSPVQTVVVKRRLSCGRYQVVKRFKPRPNGHFSITVGGPAQSQAAVYRLQTRVRKFETNPKLFPTFTLPRAVVLG